MDTDREVAWLTPGEMAERTGTTIDTLRYYEREGLIADISRSDSGHRRYDQGDVEWVEVLRCLRLTGMSIKQMKSFASLVHEGEHTQPQRYAELMEHRERVLVQLADLNRAMAVIEQKTATYEKILTERGLL